MSSAVQSGVGTSAQGERRVRRCGPPGVLAVTAAASVVLAALPSPALAASTQPYTVNCNSRFRATSGLVFVRSAPATTQASAVVPSSVVAGTRYDITQIQATTTWSPDAAQTLRLAGRTPWASGEKFYLPGPYTAMSGQSAPTLTMDSSGGMVLRTPPHTMSATAPLRTGSYSFLAYAPWMDVGDPELNCNAGYNDATMTVGRTTVTAGTAPAVKGELYFTPTDGTTNRTLSVGAPGVLANEVDPDTAAGQRLTATLVSPPTRGALSLKPDGSFTYVPNAGAVYNDSFTYTVSDGVFTSAPVKTDVYVPNQDPRASAVSYATGTGVPLVVPAPGLLRAVVEPDGQPVTTGLYSRVGNGTATVRSDGSFTYTPRAGFSGTDTFRYYATESTGGIGIGTVSVSVGTG